MSVHCDLDEVPVGVGCLQLTPYASTCNPPADGRVSRHAQILEGSDAPSPPEAFKPVYELINSIAARAASDPRKFSGFEKHWAPQARAFAVLPYLRSINHRYLYEQVSLLPLHIKTTPSLTA